MWFVVIVLIVLEASLLLISSLIMIPECLSIIIGAFLLIVVWRMCKSGRLSQRVKVSTVIVSIITFCWAIFSAYFMPYWNSITFQDVMGIDYPKSRDLRGLISQEEAEKDIVFALRKLRRIHPALLNNGQAIPVDIVKDLSLSDVDSVSVYKLYQTLQRTAASLHDAHTKVFPVLPDRHYVDYSGYGEVFSINGVKEDEFVQRFGAFISSETEEWTKRCIYSRLNSYEDLMLYGLFEGDSVQVDFISSNAGHSVRSFGESDFEPHRSTSSLSSDHIGMYWFDDEDSCGCLKMDNLYYYTPRTRIKAVKQLRSFFTQLKNRGYKHLVIDLRNNPGGNIAIAHELFRYLPIEKYRMGARYCRYGPIVTGKRIIKKNHIYKNLCFKGDVYVLTSISTFSGAMHLADYLQGNGLAKIVGESPGNTPTCYTNIAHFVLPNSRLSLNVSTGKFIRADETQDDNIIKPDLPCKASLAYQTLKEYLLCERVE